MLKTPLVSALLLALSAGGAIAAPPAFPAEEGPAIKIMTTVFPLAEITRAVAGARAEVGLILPPGAEVHTWQPRFGDVRKLSSLDAFIYIGSGLEPWAGDLLRGAGRPALRVLEIGRTLPLAPLAASDPDDHAHGREGADPHVWLDPVLDQMIADRIADFLSALEPSGAAGFRDRADAFKSVLGGLDRDFQRSLSNCRSRTFIYCGHSAFAYLARRYGLEQVAVFGASPDAAPTPRELASVIDKAKSAGVRTVFFEPGIGEKMARMIAAGAGADTRPLSAGHNLTPAETAAGRTFIDIMRTNLENLKHGLSCR
jgi:zinc transport system substrate-binding protein